MNSMIYRLACVAAVLALASPVANAQLPVPSRCAKLTTTTSFDAVNINVTRSGIAHFRFEYNIAKT